MFNIYHDENVRTNRKVDTDISILKWIELKWKATKGDVSMPVHNESESFENIEKSKLKLNNWAHARPILKHPGNEFNKRVLSKRAYTAESKHKARKYAKVKAKDIDKERQSGTKH